MIGWLILAAILLFVFVLLLRTARFRPAEQKYGSIEPVEVDAARAVEHLAEMIRVPTVSHADASKMDEDTFDRFRAMLPQMYPNVFRVCSFERVDHTGLLFCWKGGSDAAPAVLMAHYDVVPVVPERWTHPPFCGEVFDGVLWGRGTLDTKITFMGILEAAETLIAQGYTPKNDVYFSFGGDEEVNGPAAPAIVRLLQERGIAPALVVDEGGAVVEGVFPGVDRPIAVVGIGEKGMMEATLTAKGGGGHASTPPAHTAVGVLSRAVVNCEKHPFKASLSKPVRELFDRVGRYSGFGLRLVFANLWCFSGLLKRIAPMMGTELNAMMRTTAAVTMAEGSRQSNVLPGSAKATLNIRLLNTDTPEGVLDHLRRAVNDPNVTVEMVHGRCASPYADTEGPQWDALSRAIGQTWPEAIVSPYLMMACSDSYHYSAICKNVYKFSAMALTKEERGLIHNDDERIQVQNIGKTVEFFIRLMQEL